MNLVENLGSLVGLGPDSILFTYLQFPSLLAYWVRSNWPRQFKCKDGYIGLYNVQAGHFKANHYLLLDLIAGYTSLQWLSQCPLKLITTHLFYLPNFQRNRRIQCDYSYPRNHHIQRDLLQFSWSHWIFMSIWGFTILCQIPLSPYL